MTIQKIINDAVPIRELQRVVGLRSLAIALDIQIVRLVASLNIKETLNDYQVKILVEDLLDKYPNESLEDFILCFKKARMGELGKSYNKLDSEVIFGWMTIYLTEKYVVIEDQLRKERSGEYHQAMPSTDEGPGYREFKEWAKTFSAGAKVPGMTGADYEKYGQEKPVKNTATSGYKYFTVRNVQVYAVTQEHAEQLVKLMIEKGELKEENPED